MLSPEDLEDDRAVQDEYVKDTLCPVCRSTITSPEVGRIEVEGNAVYQRRACTCGATWADSYMLTGFVDLEIKCPA